MIQRIYTKEMIQKINLRRIKIKGIIKNTFLVIFIFLFLIYGYIAYQKFILKKRNVQFLGYTSYIVLTGSMEPTLKPNDIIIVKDIEEEKIKNGDIITFHIKGKNETITHRIIEIIEENGEKYYKTKGDNNSLEDTEYTRYENIEGKLVFKISKIGLILTNILTSTGLIIVSLILIISYLHSSRVEDRKLAREEDRKNFNVCKYKKEE